MSRNAPAASISSSPTIAAVQAARASAWAVIKQQYNHAGTAGYLAVWVSYPVFQLTIIGLIYRSARPGLVGYAVVGVAAGAFIFNAQYYIGQMLDEARWAGTLPALFLAPCPRISWLLGFALGGLLDTILAAGFTVGFGMLVFGVRLHPDMPALVLSAVLFLFALWGMGFLFSAIGLVIKRSNDLSNLLSPFFMLLGGSFYPVALLPLWLRIPARCLPLGYGMQALADSSLHRAGVAALAPQLLPLAGFAVALPVMGAVAFAWLERGVRERGELDLM